MQVSVLVPVYNEEKTVADVLRRLIALQFVSEVIVINDFSSDNSEAEIKSVKSKKIRLVNQSRNMGKTAAISAGLSLFKGDIVVIQDADLEYDPEELEGLIEPIVKNHADVVYGSRFLVKKAARVLYFYHYIANKALTYLSNFFTNMNMTDIETCYKAFRAPLVRGLALSSRGFGMEVELTAYIARTGARIYEVPISYYGRTYEEGKKIGTLDGLAAIYYIFYYNLIAPWKSNWRARLKALKE